MSKQPRNLLVVNHTGLYSGAEIVMLRLLGAARDRGWRVVCAAAEGPLHQQLAARHVRHVPLPDLKLPAGPRALGAGLLSVRTMVAARRLRRLAAGSDVILANGLLTLPALRLAGVDAPVVWLVHDVLRRGEEFAVLRACQSIVTLAIAPSEAVSQPLHSRGVPVRVVRHGTPWPVPPARPWDGGPRIVGMTALLTSWKGQDVLLEAAARLPRDVVIELVGGMFPKDAEYAERLRRRALEPDLSGRIRFLGWLEDPLERMRSWEVAVLPSVEPEAVGLAILEAMSLGLPVVTTKHGGAPEVLGDAGLLVRPGDADELADAITRLLGDQDLRQRCAQAGRRAIAGGLTLEDQHKRLLEVLGEVADSHQRDPTLGVVAHIVPDFEPWVGGTTRQTGVQARALAGRGHRVLVLTRRLDRRWPRHEVLDGLEIHRTGPARQGALGEKASVVAVAGWLVRHRRRLAAIQVVMYPDYVFGSAAAGRLRSTAMLWAGYGDATDVLGPATNPLRRIQHWARRQVLRRCLHIALTPTLASELRSFGLESVVIPVPIDRRKFRPPTDDERKAARTRLNIAHEFTVVFTGNLRRLKGVDRLIEAIHRLVEAGRPVHLLVVGAGTGATDDSEAQLRAQVRNQRLEDQVTFAGAVDDVLPYLWAADAFVLPSTREGMSNSLVEAMACGLACVAPVSAAGTDVLSPETGIVPPDNNPEQLARALAWLADNPDGRRLMGAAAASAVDVWSLDRVITEYERIYAELSGRRRRRSKGVWNHGWT